MVTTGVSASEWQAKSSSLTDRKMRHLRSVAESNSSKIRGYIAVGYPMPCNENRSVAGQTPAQNHFQSQSRSGHRSFNPAIARCRRSSGVGAEAAGVARGSRFCLRGLTYLVRHSTRFLGFPIAFPCLFGRRRYDFPAALCQNRSSWKRCRAAVESASTIFDRTIIIKNRLHQTRPATCPRPCRTRR